MPIAKSNPNSAGTNWARMRICLLMFFTFNFSLLIFNCGLDIEDPTPPSPPIWVQKSLPEEWPERGIDAHESGGIFLEWLSNPDEENITSYYIYRAEYFELNDSIGDYELLINVSDSSIPQHQFVDRTVSLRVKYFFKLMAENFSQNFSAFSDSLAYTLLPTINAGTMIPNGFLEILGADRILTWNGNYYFDTEEYCVTILDNEDFIVFRTMLSPRNYLAGDETWIIPHEITLLSATVYKWRIDMGGQYIEDLESAGSESPWATFLYSGF